MQYQMISEIFAHICNECRLELTICFLTTLFFILSPLAVRRKGTQKEVDVDSKLDDCFRSDVLPKTELLTLNAQTKPKDSDIKNSDVRSILPSTMWIPVRRARRLPKVQPKAKDSLHPSNNKEEYWGSGWSQAAHPVVESRPEWFAQSSKSKWSQWWRKDDAWDGWWKRRNNWNNASFAERDSSQSYKHLDVTTTEDANAHWTNWHRDAGAHPEKQGVSGRNANQCLTKGNSHAEAGCDSSSVSKSKDAAGWRAVRAALRQKSSQTSNSSEEKIKADEGSSIVNSDDPWFLWKSNRAQQEDKSNHEQFRDNGLPATTEIVNEKIPMTKDEHPKKKIKEDSQPNKYVMGIGAREFHNSLTSAHGARLM